MASRVAGLVVLSTCLMAGMVPLLPACKGPDPGEISFEERPSTSGEPGSGSSSTSGATSSSTSGGTDGGGGGTFFKGEAFKFEEPQRIDGITPPPSGHAGADAPPMENKECGKAGCHGALVGAKWGAGGHVSADAATLKFPAELKGKVQLRIVDPTGATWGDFWPDEDGNFYLSKGDAFPPEGSKVGIRTDTTPEKLMVTPIGGQTGANCMSAACHQNLKIVAK